MSSFFDDLTPEANGDVQPVVAALLGIQNEVYNPPCQQDSDLDFDSDEDEVEVYSSDDENMAPLPIQTISPVEKGTGTGFLKEHCGGTWQSKQAPSTRGRRAAVLKEWYNFTQARRIQNNENLTDENPQDEETQEAEDFDQEPFFLLKDEDGNIACLVDWTLVHDFARHYVENYCRGYATTSQWNKLLDAVQEWTNSNLMENGFPKQKGLIRSNDPLKAFGASIIRKKAEENRKNNVDIHRNFLRRTDEAKKWDFIQECILPCNKNTVDIDVLVRTQLACAYNISALTLQRSEFIRCILYKFGATRNIPGLGPDGTNCDMLIANKGKCNQNGHIEGRALPPHREPCRDASAMLGLLLVLRHEVLHEPFPFFLRYQENDLDSYCNRPVLRSVNHWKDEVSAKVICDSWNAVNSSVGIFVQKVTHQNRVEVTEMLFDLGVQGKIDWKIYTSTSFDVD